MSTTVTTTHSSSPSSSSSSSYPLSLLRPPSFSSSSSSSSSPTPHIHTIHTLPHTQSSSPSSHLPPSISPADLAVHLGPHRSVLSSSPASYPAWTSIHGHVYDLTPFLAHHPGGDVIQLAAGREAAPLLESYHGRESMPRVWASLANKCRYVGQLEGYEAPVNPAFFHTVQQRVAEHLRMRGLTYHSYEGRSVFEAFLTLALFLAATFVCCFHGSGLAALVLGVLTARMGFLMHTGNHCASSSSVRVNTLVGLFMNVIGSSHLVWRHEHQVAHHLDPNELERDNDCSIGNPFIRMHPHLPSHPWQRWQHLTVPLAITFGFVKWYISDFRHFLNGYVGSVRFAVDSAQWQCLLPLKLLWLLARVAAPLYLFDTGHALLLILIPLAIGAHYLENIFIVNHIQHGLVPPPDAHWAVKQVLGTSNWCSGSVLANLVSGGLNHQIEHHLFPSMNIHLYPTISPIVRQACKEFDLPYYDYPSFASAYVDMLRYLRAMGDPAFTPDRFTSQLQGQMDALRAAQQASAAGEATAAAAAGGTSTTAFLPPRLRKGVQVGSKAAKRG